MRAEVESGNQTCKEKKLRKTSMKKQKQRESKLNLHPLNIFNMFFKQQTQISVYFWNGVSPPKRNA